MSQWTDRYNNDTQCRSCCCNSEDKKSLFGVLSKKPSHLVIQPSGYLTLRLMVCSAVKDLKCGWTIGANW